MYNGCCMRQLLLRSCLVFLLILSVWPASLVARQDWETMQRPPLDSAEAWNLRVWLGLERSSTCRVIVSIIDQRGDTARHFLNRMLPSGYYNFYWDKRDDSGNFVDSGTYRYLVDDCTGGRSGRLFVRYKKWERLSSLSIDHFDEDQSLSFELLADSVIVTLEIENRRGLAIDRLIVDSLMHAGEYRCTWSPEKRIPSGIYTVKLRVGDFVHSAKVRYKR